MKKGICLGSIPGGKSLEERFKLAKNAGFDGVEIGPLASREEKEEYKITAYDVGIDLHSIMNQVHWSFPLSDPDPEVLSKSVQGMLNSLDTAKAVGAEEISEEIELVGKNRSRSGVRTVLLYHLSRLGYHSVCLVQA